MAEFKRLSLTEQKGAPVFVNIDSIHWMRRTAGGFTEIWFGDGKALGSRLSVVETPEEITGTSPSARKAAA